MQKENQAPKQNRKIQVAGRCSYIVTIPKRWVTEMGLSQGSRISISYHNGTSLLMTASPQTDQAIMEKKTTVLTVSENELPATTALKVANLYVAGRNSIVLRFESRLNNATKRTEISNLVRNLLIGAEVISDSQERLEIEVMLGKSELSTRGAVRRLSSVASLSLDEAIEALKLSDTNRALAVLESFEAERFGYYIQRNILGALGHAVTTSEDELDADQLAIHLLISRALVGIGTCAKEIATIVFNSSESAPLDFEEMMKIGEMKRTVLQILNSVILSFIKQDFKAAIEILNATQQFHVVETEAIKSLKNISNSERTIALVRAFSSMRKSSEICTEMADLVLKMLQEDFAEEIEQVRLEPLQVETIPTQPVA